MAVGIHNAIARAAQCADRPTRCRANTGARAGSAVSGSTRQRGFTLFELVVVIVVVAILFSLMSLSLPTSSGGQQLHREAQRLLQLMKLAREEAIIRSSLMGFSHQADSYRFYQFDGLAWTSADADSPLRERNLPEGMLLKLRVDGIQQLEPTLDEEESAPELPELIFWPDGQINGFQLSLSGEDSGSRAAGSTYQLQGSPAGSLELTESNHGQ